MRLRPTLLLHGIWIYLPPLYSTGRRPAYQRQREEEKVVSCPSQDFRSHPNRRQRQNQARLQLATLGLRSVFSVLATGYVHMGLQLVGTDKFGFQPGESGIMQVSSNCPICQFQLAHCCVVSQPSGQGILPLHLFPSYHRCWSTKCITPTRCAFLSCY